MAVNNFPAKSLEFTRRFGSFAAIVGRIFAAVRIRRRRAPKSRRDSNRRPAQTQSTIG
jgi:hypothetical protein